MKHMFVFKEREKPLLELKPDQYKNTETYREMRAYGQQVRKQSYTTRIDVVKSAKKVPKMLVLRVYPPKQGMLFN